MNEIKITPEEIERAAALIKKVAEGTTQPTEPITSWDIAEIFQTTHVRVFNRISRFYNAEATEDEKKEFEIAHRTYNRNRRTHPIWKLSENGCRIYVEKMCAEEKRSKNFVQGLEKFNALITQHFHGIKTQDDILMQGRSRTECTYIQHNAIVLRYIIGNELPDIEICRRLHIRIDSLERYIERAIGDLTILFYGINGIDPDWIGGTYV